jgi:hypothetical protein
MRTLKRQQVIETPQKQGQKVSHCGNFPNWKNIQIRDTYSTNKFIAQVVAIFLNWKNIQIHDTYSTNKFIPKPAASISPGQKV